MTFSFRFTHKKIKTETLPIFRRPFQEKRHFGICTFNVYGYDPIEQVETQSGHKQQSFHFWLH